MRVQKIRIKTRTRKVPGLSPDRTWKNRVLTQVWSCISLIRSGPRQHQNPDRTQILPSLHSINQLLPTSKENLLQLLLKTIVQNYSFRKAKLTCVNSSLLIRIWVIYQISPYIFKNYSKCSYITYCLSSFFKFIIYPTNNPILGYESYE